MNRFSIPISLIIIALFLAACNRKGTSGSSEEAETYKELSARRIGLPNGWSLTPTGRSLDLDDLPLNLVVSPKRTVPYTYATGASGRCCRSSN